MNLFTSSKDIDFTNTVSVINRFKSFISFINYQFKVNADKHCIHYCVQDSFKSLTYAQVDLLSTNLACKWSKDAKNVDVVSFIGDHNGYYLIVMLALMKLRVTMMAISPRNSEAACVSLLEKAQSELLIASTKYEVVAKAAASQASNVNVIVIESELDIETLLSEPLNPDHEALLDTGVSDQDIEKNSLIIHSSGSTAFPKPIYLSNRYMFNLINAFHINNAKEGSIKIDNSDVFLSGGPLFHLLGVFTVLSIISVGASSVFLEKLPASQNEIYQALEHNKCTAMVSSPYIYEQMISYLKERNDFSTVKRLKFALYGGASLKKEAGEWLLDHGLNVRNIYGTTEIGVAMVSDLSLNSRNYNSLSPCHHDLSGNSYCVFEVEDEADPEIVHLYIRGDSPNLATGVSNRADGGFDTNDLFKKSPEYPGYYNYLGRRDDTLVMLNGEKTNPVPMESTIRTSPVVRQAAVLGQGRQCTSALIEIDMEYAMRFTPEEILLEVSKAVASANEECPSHSILLSEMVKILPLNQSLPSTDKGTVMRKKAEVLYADVVEKLYKDFLEGPKNEKSNQDNGIWTEKKTEDFLVTCASKVLHLSESTFNDRSQSLFDHGLTSVTSIQLRNYIAEHFEKVPQNFIFQNPSISSMCKVLMGEKEEDPTKLIERRYQETQQLALEYIIKADTDFAEATNMYHKEQDKVVMLTGVTGSLGSFMLRDLLLDTSVKKVYAMIRGNPDQLMNRLVNAFESRFLDTSLLEDGRVEVLPMRFNEPFLGFTDEKYFELKNEVTIVQHCAWLLDFNMPVDHYDKECIAPFYNLLKFAYRKVNPMHVHFISSVSASAGYGNTVPEEPLPLDSHIAMPMGYAHSKFVVEILFNYLTTQKNFPCYIERLGQVCGDSVNGVWNVHEQYPLMFIGGGAIMHKMPDLDTSIDWIPVDSAAKSIADIMIRTAHLPANVEQSVYNIVNPNIIDWSDVLEAMKDTGMKFDVVPSSEWVDILATDDTNPAFKLMSFYEDSFKGSFKMPTWETKKTAALTPLISKSPILDAKLFNKFLNHWSSVGFYSPVV